MKTPQQIKKEVEKGCGKYIIGNKVLIGRDWEHDNYTCGIKRLCPSCLAKLSILTEYDKTMKDMIDRLKESLWLVNSTNDRTLELIYPDINDLIRKKIEKFEKELLSKIGDNSEEKQDDKT